MADWQIASLLLALHNIAHVLGSILTTLFGVILCLLWITMGTKDSHG